MLRKCLPLGLVLVFCLGQLVNAQSNAESALAKAREAVELMDNGKYDESIKLLEEAQVLDPGRFDYPYELAYAYYLKEDYKQAIKILEKNIDHKDVTEQLFQLLGNSYDILGKTDKAFKSYDAGLERFPNSGVILLEKGNVFWNKKEYEKALPFYEKGIKLDPEFPSNYYRAALIYCNSTEEVWGMIYGELFMNLERNSKRTAEISKLLYDTYKSEITFTSDTTLSVSFSKNATIEIDPGGNPDLSKLPYGIGVYEPTLILSIISIKSLDINSLDVVRSNFLENYISRGFDKTYPNLLFEFQKKVKDAGHLESYNHWILMKGDEEGFDKWYTDNTTKWENFVAWFTDNGIVVDENHRFYRQQY